MWTELRTFDIRVGYCRWNHIVRSVMDLNKSKFALHDLSGASFLSDSMTLILRIRVRS